MNNFAGPFVRFLPAILLLNDDDTHDF